MVSSHSKTWKPKLSLVTPGPPGHAFLSDILEKEKKKTFYEKSCIISVLLVIILNAVTCLQNISLNLKPIKILLYSPHMI